MLGWVAAVSATESPSQLSPALIQRMWTTGFPPGSFGGLLSQLVTACAPLATGDLRPLRSFRVSPRRGRARAGVSPPTARGKSVVCASWMRCTEQKDDEQVVAAARWPASSPSCPPSPTVSMPEPARLLERAYEVERIARRGQADAMSPGRPEAASCRANTTSKPTSLAVL